MVATYIPGMRGPIVMASTAGGGGGPSAWDPSGHGTDIALTTATVTNDTATVTGTNWNAVRGTAGKTTGKWAFEIKLLSSGAAIMFGLIDQTTAGGAGMTNAFSIPDGVVEWSSGSCFVQGADFSGSGLSAWSPAINDIYGVQADLTSGKIWFSLNGVSMAGDPVAGTGNPVSIANHHVVYPSCSIIVNPTVVQLITGTLNTPVTGYTAWG